MEKNTRWKLFCPEYEKISRKTIFHLKNDSFYEKERERVCERECVSENEREKKRVRERVC